jgi:biotin carboxyl carrier protein
MKYKVKVEDQIYEVEIENLHTRPVIALVDGEPFEVWPEDIVLQAAPIPASKPSPAPRSSSPPPARSTAAQPRETSHPKTEAVQPPAGSALHIVRAPIPGVITSVSVSPGDEVMVGQSLCILEAMKMNNSIRASRSGRVATVHVAVGQHVKHNDPLVEFME